MIFDQNKGRFNFTIHNVTWSNCSWYSEGGEDNKYSHFET